VVVLDEATADARTLEAATRRALAGRTALVVAHRLTQAAAADRVIVLDRGRVVEDGTHDDLVAAGGAYATLWRAWSGRGTAGNGNGGAVRTAPAPTAERPATPDGRAPSG
jgi:ATP-binding cassette, subfamily C, bacterial